MPNHTRGVRIELDNLWKLPNTVPATSYVFKSVIFTSHLWILNSEIFPSYDFPQPSLFHELCTDLHYNNGIDILSPLLQDKDSV